MHTTCVIIETATTCVALPSWEVKEFLNSNKEMVVNFTTEVDEMNWYITSSDEVKTLHHQCSGFSISGEEEIETFCSTFGIKNPIERDTEWYGYEEYEF